MTTKIGSETIVIGESEEGEEVIYRNIYMIGGKKKIVERRAIRKWKKGEKPIKKENKIRKMLDDMNEEEKTQIIKYMDTLIRKRRSDCSK